MEELDLLKKDWKKNENSFRQVSENEIYKMIHENSSSVVKWIMIIGIIEFLFWIGINLISNSDDYFKNLEAGNILLYMKIFGYVNSAIIIFFIYQFYKNYVVISTTDSTRTLMKNILKTRKAVNTYVWYNLIVVFLSFITGILLAYFCNPEIAPMRDKIEHGGTAMALGFIGGSLFILAILITLVWLFYKLLYGFLMKKLQRNYQELKKIDL
ncbi:hypothetical protein ACFPVY_05590 [Flavobacterium qiangtangense]|uniref:DUF898 family protein n=1 Tax=Flavobacterium qiangtangense TaxID=1442595 RepID=A0ABW1PKH6_9FLAO